MKIDWTYIMCVLCKVLFVICLGIICGVLLGVWW